MNCSISLHNTLNNVHCFLLLSLGEEDVWSYAKKLPHLFQQGGVFYSIVKKDMGPYVRMLFKKISVASKIFLFFHHLTYSLHFLC